MEEWKLTKIGSLCKRVCSGGTPKIPIYLQDTSLAFVLGFVVYIKAALAL